MAYTQARTWVAGETVTAALLNTHLRDNLQSRPEASTVTALNALYNGTPGNGAPGFIKVGSSPFDIVALKYDATLSKWVEEDADLMVSLVTDATTTATTYTLAAAGPLMPLKAFTDAGLLPSLRVETLAIAGASSSVQVAGLVSTGDAAGALTLDTTNVTGAATTSSASAVIVDGGWTAISLSITVKQYCALGIGIKRTGTANGTAKASTALWMRWTS